MEHGVHGMLEDGGCSSNAKWQPGVTVKAKMSIDSD